MKKSNESILKSCLMIAFALVASIGVQAQSKITLSDPEIASVAVTANQIDVDYGKIALSKTKNADIKQFAQTMIDDHTGVIGLAVDLAKKLNVTPKDNAMTQSLLDGAKKTKADLHKKTGKAFDKAYVDNEVAYHKAVIDAVEKVLIPQTKNAELKALLEKVTPTLKMHLKHAEMMQSKFK